MRFKIIKKIIKKIPGLPATSASWRNKLQTSAGFTVVELIVAMGLFVILLGIVSGSFINALRTQRRIVALVAANDNANISLEQMAREIRTGVSGTFDLVGTDYADLQFTNAKGEIVTYRKNNESIERSAKANVGDENNYKQITADNVKVKSLGFVLCDPSDCPKPRITIALGVSPNDPDPALADTVLRMQTTISARF